MSKDCQIPPYSYDQTTKFLLKILIKVRLPLVLDVDYKFQVY